jgi:predicted hydrocarbon binding protein
MEEAAKFAPIIMQLAMRGSGAFAKAFYQRYGKEALPIISGIMSQGGVEWGKMAQQMVPAKGMKAYGESLKMISSIMGMGVEIVELSDDKIHFKGSKCPLGIEGTSRELCEAMMGLDKSWMSAFLGQEVQIKVLKSVAAGDKICEVIESKSQREIELDSQLRIKADKDSVLEKIP